MQHGGIRNWKADSNRGVWIQDVHRNWYYAKLAAPCFGLNVATSLAKRKAHLGVSTRTIRGHHWIRLH